MHDHTHEAGNSLSPRRPSFMGTPGDRPLGISGRLLKPVRPKLSGVRFRADTRPPNSPTIVPALAVACRSNPPAKKSDEAPAGYYRLPIFRKEIRL